MRYLKVVVSLVVIGMLCVFSLVGFAEDDVICEMVDVVVEEVATVEAVDLYSDEQVLFGADSSIESSVDIDDDGNLVYFTVDGVADDAMNNDVEGPYSEGQDSNVEAESYGLSNDDGVFDVADNEIIAETTAAMEYITPVQVPMASSDKVDMPVGGKNFDSAVTISVGLNVILSFSA